MAKPLLASGNTLPPDGEMQARQLEAKERRELMATRDHVGILQSIGKQERKDGWVLKTESRPGMKWADSFYGNDWGMVEAVTGHEGEMVTLVLERGRLKDGKPEGSTYDDAYWENTVSIHLGGTTAQPQPASDRTSGGDQGWPLDAKDLKIAWGQAVNCAVAFLTPTYQGRDNQEDCWNWEMGESVRAIAVQLYPIITAGPPAASPEPATEAATDGPGSDAQLPERPEGPPGQVYCQNPEHNNAPLLSIMGQEGKVGHPLVTPDGSRSLCQGTAPDPSGPVAASN